MTRSGAKLRLRRRHLAADFFAGSLGDILPGERIVVDGALPGARMLAGGAVVLARLGDAEALVFACVRRDGGSRGRGGQPEREQTRNGGLDDGLLLHGRLL